MSIYTNELSGLYGVIYEALAQLDLSGEDEQVTRAMSIVTEAFILNDSRSPITVEQLLAKADAVIAQQWTD